MATTIVALTDMLDTCTYVMRAWNQPGPLSAVTGRFYVKQTSGNSTREAQSASDQHRLPVVSSMDTITILLDIISETIECATSADILLVAPHMMFCYSFPEISSNIDEGSHILGGHQSDFLGRHSLY
jgi:hypothetical protein